MKLSRWLVRVGVISSAGALCAIALPLTGVSISSSMAQEVNCANATTQQVLNLCAHQDAEASDKKLNQTYQQLLSQLRGEPRRQLIDAQRLWIKYRDATCSYKYDGYSAGSIASMMYFNCVRQLSERRIKDLDNYLQPR